MKRKLQIFVSSTYKDLLDERQAAVSAILKAGHIPAGMELFAAGDESQWETIKRWIEESDVYMLILGGRYGSIEPKSQLSYIELEYDYAVSLKKPHFAAVIEEKVLDERVKTMGKEVLELTNPAKLAAFRGKVLSKMSSFFSDAKDIKLAIHELIRDLETRHKMTGWASGSEIPDVSALTAEINRITGEKQTLLSDLEELRKRTISDDPQIAEFNQLFGLLQNIQVDLPKGGDKAGTVLMLEALFIVRDFLSVGVTNQVGCSETDQWIYFNVCPTLQIHELVENEKVPRAFSI